MTDETGKLRVVIVDDEELARSVVREHLARHPDIEIVAECVNGFEAVKTITEQRPDLVFLDIQMPKLTGFEVLDLVEKHNLAVVFITAFDEFALKAFEVHAVDYLLKPFRQERFDEALGQARLKRWHNRRPELLQEVAHAARPHTGHSERILVRDGTNVHVIPADRIDYIEAQDDYVCIRAEGRKHLKQVTLSAVELDLDPQKFVRIHRSYLLNVDRLAKIELYAKDSRVAILHDGTKLQVSRAGHARLKELL
jgi:two-component system LytT family response regulator